MATTKANGQADLSRAVRAVVLAGVVALAGCETVSHKAKVEFEDAERRVEKYSNAKGKDARVDEEVSIAWIGNRQVPRRDNLPHWFEQERLWVSQQPVGLWRIAARISQATNTPVNIDPDVQIVTEEEQQGQQALAGTAGMNAELQVRSPRTEAIRYNSRATATEFLDEITGRFGLTWRYQGGAVVISRRLQQVYTVPVLQGAETFTASIGGGTGVQDQEITGGGSTDSTEQTSLTQQIDYTGEHDRWRSVADTVEGLLSPIGEMREAPTLGHIVVNDTPAVHQAVEAYLERATWLLTQQIHIDVQVIAVTVDERTDFGMDWAVLYESSDISTIFSAANNDPAATNFFAARITDPDSKWVDSQTIVNALSERTEVSVLTRAAAKTLNNKPTPLTSTNTAGYLKELTTTQSLEFVTQGLTAGSITTGTSLTVYPRILDDGRIMLRFDGALSQLLAFTEITTAAGDSIQIPNYDSRAFNDEIVLNSGAIAVLNVFSSTRGERGRAGQGSPHNVLMGNRNDSMERTDVVILIQPRIVDGAGVEV